MSLVGNFPGLLNQMHRRTIRGPINPMDKSTVVSIYPKPIHENKVTIQPGVFDIEPGSFEKPAILVVGPSSWWRDIDEDQPLLEIPVGSIQVADSVVRDYCNGIFGCNMGDSMPGLFYVPGEYTVKDIKDKFKKELDNVNRKQNKFFETLVNAADALWARSNGNPLAVSEDMRMAARALGVQGNRDWMKTFIAVNQVRCKACGNLKNPEYPICASCHFPDPDHPMTAQLLAAKNQLPKQG